MKTEAPIMIGWSNGIALQVKLAEEIHLSALCDVEQVTGDEASAVMAESAMLPNRLGATARYVKGATALLGLARSRRLVRRAPGGASSLSRPLLELLAWHRIDVKRIRQSPPRCTWLRAPDYVPGWSPAVQARDHSGHRVDLAAKCGTKKLFITPEEVSSKLIARRPARSDGYVADALLRIDEQPSIE